MVSDLPEEWEMVIGLEVHAELATATKLFCRCANSFGDEPNTNICPVCLGLPGSLPVTNALAVEFAMRLGRALGCEVARSVFARKNYFYPDMPKDYQISQYDQPTNLEGSIELPDGTKIGIERAHIEEDTGKSTHLGASGRIHNARAALIDYNRAGVPLVEIVSKPELRSADDAKAYVGELREILLATGVSHARMEEGSMRVDANVSVRPTGSQELRTRCEIKNINSLRSLGRAIKYEASRQADLWISGGTPMQETRHWDEDSGRTTAGRSKENADDYRYFADPDLPPLAPDAAGIAAIDGSLPELPSQRRRALASVAGVALSDTALAVERGLDRLASHAIESGGPSRVVLKHVGQNLAEGPGLVSGTSLAALARMEDGGSLTPTQAKSVLAEMAKSGGEPSEIAKEMGFEAMDTAELETLIDELVGTNPEEWQRYIEGDKKVAGFFIGQIMSKTGGKADGKVATMLLTNRARR